MCYSPILSPFWGRTGGGWRIVVITDGGDDAGLLPPVSTESVDLTPGVVGDWLWTKKDNDDNNSNNINHDNDRNNNDDNKWLWLW